MKPMAAPRKFTKEDILLLLEQNPDAVKRAIVALYERQVEDERSSRTARVKNNAGFSQATAPAGTGLARAILARQQLNENQMRTALSIARHHANQLARIANEQAARREKEAADAQRLQHQRGMYDDVVSDIEQILGRPVNREKFNAEVKRRAARLGDSSPEGLIGAAQEILEDMQERSKK
jgi:hypothetical protein